MAYIAIAISAVSTVVSGVVGYVGAQNAAAAADQQAKHAEQMGIYNATVARNQAQAQAQDLDFQSGVSQFNQKQALMDRDFRSARQNKQLERDQASLAATASKRGVLSYSFDDILRAEEDFQQAAFLDDFAKGSQQAYGFSSQSKQNDFMARRTIEAGAQQGALARSEGYASATALRNQASSLRTGGYGTLIGGVGSAAGTVSVGLKK